MNFQEQCAFTGAWRGPPSDSTNRVYYVSSYFWDRATDAGIISDHHAIDWKTTPAEFAQRAAGVCGKKADDVAALYPRIPVDQLPYLCTDLSFCHTILTKGFKISDSSSVTLVKRVLYNGQPVEAAWPLGAAINQLGAQGH